VAAACDGRSTIDLSELGITAVTERGKGLGGQGCPQNKVMSFRALQTVSVTPVPKRVRG
jgi:hypothetical protein